MPKPIGFDPATGLIVIQDNGVFPARSLTAYASLDWTDRIQIDNLAGKGIQTVPWTHVTSLDSAYVPESMADALAYLAGEFAKEPEPIAGPRGPGIFSAAGSPEPDLGMAGDLYLDAISGDLYTKGA